MQTTSTPNIPPRRYLNRDEAAAWLGVSVDTFSIMDIPYCDFGPRLKRWDIVDIEDYANDNKSCDSARTSKTKRRRQTCDSTNVKVHRNGGQLGTTRKVEDSAKALGLTIRT